jgi:snurportin-1
VKHSFWWRDTRLSELPPLRPPTAFAPPTALQASTQEDTTPPIGYRFPYPTTFLQIPYHTNTTFAHFVSTIVPRARSPYRAQVSIPPGPHDDMDVMDIESPQFTGPATRHVQAEIQSDGLLLYVAQAIYEPGASPLSSWVPLATPVTDKMVSMEQSSPLDVFER